MSNSQVNHFHWGYPTKISHYRQTGWFFFVFLSILQFTLLYDTKQNPRKGANSSSCSRSPCCMKMDRNISSRSASSISISWWSIWISSSYFCSMIFLNILKSNLRKYIERKRIITWYIHIKLYNLHNNMLYAVLRSNYLHVTALRHLITKYM